MYPMKKKRCESTDFTSSQVISLDEKKIVLEIVRFVTSSQVFVDGNKTSYVASGLLPVTMYEVQIISENSHGSSMPTPAVRALTLASPDESDATASNSSETYFAHLPNITRCCEEKGVPEGKCLRSLCDPSDDEDTK
ncbi:ig-like and fibronectin type-III domain-containing protein [Trichonephila clavipes]|nr:ig-like and fibronectin type-III domain-containing protein [Trichonephila clavipes]